ncbi:MAG: hypothetical protein KC449_21715 [Anaerolineales bacterium]|nr:hypothetical protein [Anaerolineales bacterium]
MQEISEIVISVDVLSFALWLFNHVKKNYSSFSWSNYPTYLLTKEGGHWESATEYRIILSFNSALKLLNNSGRTIEIDMTKHKIDGAIHLSVLCSESMDLYYPQQLVGDIKRHWEDEIILEETSMTLTEKARIVLDRLFQRVHHDTEVAISVYELRGELLTEKEALQVRSYLISEGLAKPGRTAIGKPTIRITFDGIKFLEPTPQVEYERGDVIMGDKIEVHLGDHATIYGSFTVAKRIESSFNKVEEAPIQPEIKALLKELSIAVGKMSEEMPEEEGERVARALEVITDEATSRSPNRKWWQVSVDGLTEAAKNVGKIGEPVLKLIGLLIPILEKLSNL